MPAAFKTNYRQYLGGAICILNFTLLVTAFFPGLMSPDSLTNLTCGRQNVFQDINSPLMSYLWGKLDAIYSGSALMFVLQNLFFWGACWIFWQATKQKSFYLGIFLAAFALMPQIFSQLTTVWKDVGLGASLLMASALVYYAAAAKNKFVLLISPVFLFYGCAVRLNAFPAILPLAVWSAFVAGKVFSVRRKNFWLALSGLIYFGLIAGAAYFVNYRITQGKTVYPFQQVELYDLAAISIDRNEASFPEYIVRNENFSLENVKARYNVRSVNSLIYDDNPNAGDRAVLKLSTDSQEIKTLREKWIETASENKRSYLAHRWRIFAQLVGLTGNTISNPYWDFASSSGSAEFQVRENTIGNVLLGYFNATRKIGFFHGFVGILLCAFFLYRAIKNKFAGDWQIVAALSASCLLFTLAYFPTAPSTEFRYLFWSAISAAVTTVFGGYLLLSERRQRRIARQESGV